MHLSVPNPPSFADKAMQGPATLAIAWEVHCLVRSTKSSRLHIMVSKLCLWVTCLYMDVSVLGMPSALVWLSKQQRLEWERAKLSRLVMPMPTCTDRLQTPTYWIIDICNVRFRIRSLSCYITIEARTPLLMVAQCSTIRCNYLSVSNSCDLEWNLCQNSSISSKPRLRLFPSPPCYGNRGVIRTKAVSAVTGIVVRKGT